MMSESNINHESATVDWFLKMFVHDVRLQQGGLKYNAIAGLMDLCSKRGSIIDYTTTISSPHSQRRSELEVD